MIDTKIKSQRIKSVFLIFLVILIICFARSEVNDGSAAALSFSANPLEEKRADFAQALKSYYLCDTSYLEVRYLYNGLQEDHFDV